MPAAARRWGVPAAIWGPVALLLTWGCVSVAHVAPRDLAAFVTYQGLVVVLPGFLVLEGLKLLPSAPLGHRVVVGWGLGMAVELPFYLVCARLGAPRGTWLLAVGALAVLIGRRAKRHRKPEGASAPEPATRVRMDWAWAGVAAGLAVLLLVVIVDRFRLYPADDLNLLLDSDESFTLAVTTELMHHVGHLEFPYVDGTPLHYHWGVMAQFAASARGTGVDALTTVRVLGPLALLCNTVLMVSTLTARIFRCSLAGALAPWILAFLSQPDVFGWSPPASAAFGPLLNSYEWFFSQSQGLGCSLILLFALLLSESLRRPRMLTAVVSLWVLVMLGLAKAPLFAVAVVAQLAVSVLAGRRAGHARWIALFGAAGAIGAFGFLTAVVYGGSTRSSALLPGQVLGQAYGAVLGWSFYPPTIAFGAPLFLLTLALLGAPMLLWLLRFRGTLDLGALPLAMIWLVSVIGWLMLGHVYLSQIYLLYVAGLASAAFLAGWLGRALGSAAGGRETVRRALRLAALAVAGAVVIHLLGLALYRTGIRLPTHDLATVLAVTWLPALLLAAVGGVGTALWRQVDVRGKGRALKGFSHAAGGPGTAVAFALVVGSMLSITAAPWQIRSGGPDLVPLPAMGASGGLAARWLRDHSRVDDLVATNAHCNAPQADDCVSHHFWIAGLSERHVLVEGWGYIPRPETAGRLVDSDRQPYWDPAGREVNDAVFRAPSPATVAGVQRRGVRWLFADLRLTERQGELAALGRRAERIGDYLVVDLGPPPLPRSAPLGPQPRAHRAG